MENLNEIKDGVVIQFKGVPDGIVKGIMTVVRNESGDIVEGRYIVDHRNGHESYHTYRYDGISHHHADHDIIGLKST